MSLISSELVSPLQLYLQKAFAERLHDDVKAETLAAKGATGVVSESMATVFTEMNCSRITVELRQNHSGDYWIELRLKTRNQRRAR